MIRVLHVIQSLSLGGATRALIATAKYSTRAGGFRHSAISLLPAAPEALNLAAEANVEVFNAPDRLSIFRMMAESDIVHVNFWNNPEIYDLLRSELPPVRLLLWYHIAGDGRPQIITRQLVEFADFNIASNPFTFHDLPVFREMTANRKTQCAGMVYDAADYERVKEVGRREHSFFNVGYIGTVSFTKMHPNYVAMSSAVRIPEARFIVCGGGIEPQLKQQALSLSDAHRFDFRGYVSDIRPVIEILDVYGYPLCENSYASSELNLQEVMVCGIPPVVFPYGGVKQLIVNDYTGLVVRTEKEYSDALEHLHREPAERERIGRNAREYALQIFGAENAARKLEPLYQRMMQQPKRPRTWGLASEGGPAHRVFPIETGPNGAQKFVESLGAMAEEFAVSLNGTDDAQVLAAETKIGQAAPILCHEYGGGILHYKNCYPADPHLRLWAGLVRLQQDNPAEASKELRESLRMGLRHWRVWWYLALAAEQVKDVNAALSHLREVTRVAPGFLPAQNLLQRIEGPSKQRSVAVNRPSLPKITVVTPSFNQGAFLEDCIYSVLNQNYPNLEYIIMDGGSTDNSLAIIRKYAKYLTHWQSEPDGGQYAAIQQGFRLSTGSLMTWLNSDDRFHPFAFETIAAAFSKRPEVSWIMGRPNSITSTGQPKSFSSALPRWSRQLYLELKYRYPFIQQEGTFWRRALWEKAGARLRTEMKMAGDLELWTRFFRHAQLYTLGALVGSFRYQPDQKTQSLLPQYFAEAESVLREEIVQFQLSSDKTLMPAPDLIGMDSLDLDVQVREMSSMNEAKFFLACGDSEGISSPPAFQAG